MPKDGRPAWHVCATGGSDASTGSRYAQSGWDIAWSDTLFKGAKRPFSAIISSTEGQKRSMSVFMLLWGIARGFSMIYTRKNVFTLLRWHARENATALATLFHMENELMGT